MTFGDRDHLLRSIESYKALIEVLENEIEDLKERFIYHGTKGPDPVISMIFHLTRHEAVIMHELMHRTIATKENCHAALYFAKIDTEPEIKIVDVFVCKMRPKLKRHDVNIETMWGSGYYLSPVNKAKVKALVKEITDAELPEPSR